jgi:hypothetical protein
VGFKIANVDDEPVAKVELSWTQTADSDLRQDFLMSNSATRMSAEVGVNPAYISAHQRTIVGYRVHRDSNNPNFAPVGEAAGQGNCVADESSLTPPVTNLTDLAVITGAHYYYKIGQVINT